MDLAAHCVNDVLCAGADPLFLLDYVAANRIELEQVTELVEGAAEVCRAAGCMLIGGETAELPGVYREHELDFAGTCVGIVDRDRMIDGARCAPGDVVVGLAWAGIHTNGFSLVRSLVGDGDFDAELLLAPHRLYVDEVRALRAAADVKALAHVTGGGIPGNLGRVLPDGVEARIDWDAWERPPVFGWLAERGVAEDELRRVFNLGIGMCAVVPEAPAGATVIGELRSVIGVLVSAAARTSRRSSTPTCRSSPSRATRRRPAPSTGPRRRASRGRLRARRLPRPRRPRRRNGRLARSQRRPPRRPRRLHAHPHPRLPRPFPGRRRQRPSVAAAGVPGAHAVEEQLASGVDESGASVHFVDEGVDSGPVLAQERVPVLAGDDPESLHERIKAVEHRLLPEVVRELCAR